MKKSQANKVPAKVEKLEEATKPQKIYTINRRELAKIPAHLVALIAAQLNTPESRPVERVRLAFRLLDIAESACRSLKHGTSYDGGLSAYEFAQAQKHAGMILHEDRRKDPLIEICSDGFRRANFSKVLKKFFGLARGKDIRNADRLKRFISYVEDTGAPSSVAAILHYNIQRADGPMIQREAAERIVKGWRERGIPPAEYVVMKRLFPWWWGLKLSKTRRRAAKAKQGSIEACFDANFFDELDTDFGVLESPTGNDSSKAIDFVGLEDFEIAEKIIEKTS
jgi:hypothetical protein